MPHKKIPITLLTGFLGSGKTTLLNHILTAPHGQKIAVIVNEFGDIGIDDRLIKKNTNGIVELVNGCICCSVKNDTLQTMLQLIDERKELQVFDRVVIETTGLANPVPFVAAFLSKPLLKNYYVLDGVITLVDAAHILMQLKTAPEVHPQIAIANLVLINKTDLVNPALLESIEFSLYHINPIARFKRTQQAKIDLSEIFSLQRFDAQSFLKIVTLETEHHHLDISTLILREEKPLSMDKVAFWIGSTMMMHAQDLLRYKGILSIAGKEERLIFQGVHMHFENTFDQPWGKDEKRLSEVVLIGKNLDQALFETSFKECVADED